MRLVVPLFDTPTSMTCSRETVSVVICTHAAERWADLEAAVGSVRQQTLAACQIIVVADHNAALLSLVKERLPEVTALENRGKVGLSAARNAGLAAARGTLIAFLDDDASAAPEWLERLAESYSGPNVLGVGGVILPRWPQSGPPAWFPDEFNWVVGCTYRGMPDKATAVRNVIGANMSFRREAVAAVGGFREGLGRVGFHPSGAEETDLCIRLRERWPEGEILYNPAARVSHRVAPDRASWSYFLARCVGEGRSKAILAQLVGRDRALATERHYARQTLPRGVMRGVRDSVSGDAEGVLRSGAILIGLAATTAGYVDRRWARRLAG